MIPYSNLKFIYSNLKLKLFLKFLNWRGEGQNKILWNFGNLTLNWGKGGEGSLIKWEGEANLFFALSVILTSSVYFVIWSTFQDFP